MNEKEKRTLILAAIISTLFSCYDEDEKTKLHKELHRRVGLGVRKQVKRFGKDLVIEVSHKQGGEIWANAVDYFREENITIEASSCILAIVNLDEKALSKHYGLGAGKLGKWAVPTRCRNASELEKQSNIVARYVFDRVNELYGIEAVTKVSVLERIRLAKDEK